MKTIEEIERDVEFRILNARQSEILAAGPEFSAKWVNEWDSNRSRMEALKKEGCKRKL